MKRIWAIARLTLAEGLRMRLVVALLVVLGLIVLRMPFALRGDETLAGRLQNFLSYALGALSILLGVATVFFSSATLANELRDRSLHMVVTKPVTRMQILVGKWVGVCLLNLLVITLAGAAIYGLACFLGRLPVQFERDRYKLQDVVWTARVAARPVMPDLGPVARDLVRKRIESGELDPLRERQAVAEQVTMLSADYHCVRSGYANVYEFQGLAPPSSDAKLQVRFKVKAIPLPAQELAEVYWVFVDPDTGEPLHEPARTLERSGDRHQFLVSASVVKNGRAALQVMNPFDPQYNIALLFEGSDSLEILYRVGGWEGSFEINFLKALGMIFLRLMFLAALGVFFGSFVSFPVACLCVAMLYVISLGMPFWMESIGANLQMPNPKTDPYGAWGPYVRFLYVPALRFLFPDFTELDGGRFLVDGVYIPYALLWRALVHTAFYGGLVLLLPGWLIFRRREVAEVVV